MSSRTCGLKDLTNDDFLCQLFLIRHGPLQTNFVGSWRQWETLYVAEPQVACRRCVTFGFSSDVVLQWSLLPVVMWNLALPFDRWESLHSDLMRGEDVRLKGLKFFGDPLHAIVASCLQLRASCLKEAACFVYMVWIWIRTVECQEQFHFGHACCRHGFSGIFFVLKQIGPWAQSLSRYRMVFKESTSPNYSQLIQCTKICLWLVI